MQRGEQPPKSYKRVISGPPYSVMLNTMSTVVMLAPTLIDSTPTISNCLP